MTPQPEWIDKAEAAARINITERATLNLATKGRIKSKKQRRHDGQVVVMLNAADVERYAYERDHPAEKQNNVASELPAVYKQAQSAKLRLFEDHWGLMQQVPKPWLTLDDAAEYSGLPAPSLAKLIRSGKLPALDLDEGKDRKGGGRVGGRYRINRRDLDKLEAR